MSGPVRRFASVFAVLLAASFLAGVSSPVIWDMSEKGRFDATNMAYAVADGRVIVDLGSPKPHCPTGLGNIVTGRDIRDVVIRYESSVETDAWLCITWNPGQSGIEQFEVSSNGALAWTSDAVDAPKNRQRDLEAAIKVSVKKGANELLLHYISGDGMHFRAMALTTKEPAPRPQPALTAEPAGDPGDADAPLEEGICPPEAVNWDMNAGGRFDPAMFTITEGRVNVDLSSKASHCPMGLGEVAGARRISEISILYDSAKAGDAWLHVTWNPGGSGMEQFRVISNGDAPWTSRAVVAADKPDVDIDDTVKVGVKKGRNELVLRYVSGDGLRFKALALTSAPRRPAAPEPVQTVRADLRYPTAEAYSATIKEPGIVLESTHVLLFAPKRAEKEANIILPYLARAYDELYKIVGIHTKYKIVVYAFPPGHPDAEGNTSECVLWYGYENPELVNQPEWQRYKVPHVSGYIEEMAHNFVSATGAQFGWEMMGWSLGIRVSGIVAPNPVFEFNLKDVRRQQADTWRRYKAAGNTFPADVPGNLVDRIHAYILQQCEQKYGDSFWRGFFAEVVRERAAFDQIEHTEGGDAGRNLRYQLTVKCFDRLKGVDMTKRLTDNGISTTIDVESLHPDKRGWNRKLE